MTGKTPAIKMYHRPKSLRDAPMHYCPGCGHGVAHRVVAEVVDDLDIRDKVIGVAPVGCSVIAYDYWDFDVSEAAHGRALAVATGIKRCRPGCTVFTYQGDGDLASIGVAETVHAANRGENLTCIFINNAVYGMTGGQTAPTTLSGQKTATAPWGRDPSAGEGFPLKISEMLACLDGVCYIERTTTATVEGVRATKKAVRQAFLNQMRQKGFSLVEVLSQCPTVWGKTPQEAVAWVKQKMARVFPLGRIK